jgi:hypothetical protein
MKTPMRILWATACIAVATPSSWAGDVLLSPRQQEHRNSIMPRPGEEIDRLDRSIKTQSPKTRQFFAELSKRPSTDVDLALRPTLGMSNKHLPHGVVTEAIGIAPLK